MEDFLRTLCTFSILV